MVSLLVYKGVLLILLTAVPASFGASAYYNQQQTNTLNNHISDLTSKLDNANDQLSKNNQTIASLNSQVTTLNGQLSNLNDQISQLQNQIQHIDSEIANLTQTLQASQIMVLSKGTITLPGYPTNCYTFNETCLNGGVAFINFTVPTNVLSATLNVSFSLGCSNCPRLSLLTPSQYKIFTNCNCLERGNYTSIPTTWSSPLASSYTAQVVVPSSGLWILAFQLGAGIVNPPNGPYLIDETIALSTTNKA